MVQDKVAGDSAGNPRIKSIPKNLEIFPSGNPARFPGSDPARDPGSDPALL